MQIAFEVTHHPQYTPLKMERALRELGCEFSATLICDFDQYVATLKAYEKGQATEADVLARTLEVAPLLRDAADAQGFQMVFTNGWVTVKGP